MFDTIIKNVRVVRPDTEDMPYLDVGIKNGAFAAIERDLDPTGAQTTLIAR